MGEERAAVADIPKTDKVTQYAWRGYELLDTPGINAPIAHQEISLEALSKCQVVIFVVSAARSFENRKIYEAMRDVTQKGKRLFIVLNDKEGLGNADERVVEAKKAVQRNLLAIGFSDEEAANFRMSIVNSQLALEGRLEDDAELVQESGILDLEDLLLAEIKRINGFHVHADLAAYLIACFEPYTKALLEAASVDDPEHSGMFVDFFNIRNEYESFVIDLERKVDQECAGLANALLAAFPSANEIAISGTLNTDAAEKKVKELAKWSNAIID